MDSIRDNFLELGLPRWGPTEKKERQNPRKETACRGKGYNLKIPGHVLPVKGNFHQHLYLHETRGGMWFGYQRAGNVGEASPILSSTGTELFGSSV